MGSDSSEQSVRLVFVNQTTSNRTFLIRNPTLLQGAWTRSPDEWDPPNTVPWQQTQEAAAEGTRPTGVDGQVALEIPIEGEQPPVNQVTFRNDAAGVSFLIDGVTPFKTIVVGNDIFFANLTERLDGSTLVGTLTLTGGDAAQIAAILMRGHPWTDG